MVDLSSTSFWPEGMPRQQGVAPGTLWQNLEAAAARAPERPAIVFCDTALPYAALQRQAEHLAGWLQQVAGVQRGDRVLLFSQNCPQFTCAYYAVLRAEAVVVPVNAMSTADELAWLAADAGARVAIVASELAERAAALLTDGRLHSLLVHAYADAVAPEQQDQLPDWVAQAAQAPLPAGATRWNDALSAKRVPSPYQGGREDLCVLPYTSGTTGHPKGCRHPHRTLQHSIAASRQWRALPEACVMLSVAPMFHLLGMQNGMNLPVLLGGTVVMLPRWDRVAAARLIERWRVRFWAAPPPMITDFFAQPGIEDRDLSSLKLLAGGGAAMPEAVSTLLRERYGITYSEAYGLTETASFLHANPLGREKPCCLGVPTFDVHTLIVDPETLEPVAPGETGELVTSAPQVMLGYWNRPEADAQSFFERDGRRWFRTGDLCAADHEGYVFMRDRLKRMVNVSGYKVWPAEVENALYAHPAVLEACVIASPAAKGGEAVKAVVVLRPGVAAPTEAELMAWAREHMAIYKAPRVVQFVEALPRSGTGKIAWRQLQEQEMAAVAATHQP